MDDQATDRLSKLESCSETAEDNALKRKYTTENQLEASSNTNVEPDVKVVKLAETDCADVKPTEVERNNKDDKSVIDLDPLAYTKTGFTSEIFKIQIHNLPKFGFHELKKRLMSLGLKPHKLKSPRPEVTYVCFRNENDRRNAIEKLNGHKWKGKILSAKEAAPLEDPFLQKLKASKEGTVTCVETFTPEESLKKLKDNVMPLWELEYQKQLEFKNGEMTGVLRKLAQHKCVRDEFRKRPGWRHHFLACPLLPIMPSPKLTEYRNKNEFSVGYDQDGKTIKVGFRYGLYKKGTTCIGDIEGVDIIKPAALKVVQSFEQFLSKSEWDPYLQQTDSGYWYQLTVRTFESGDVMAMVDFKPRELDKSDLNRALDSVKEYYTKGSGKDLDIKSFYFRTHGKPPQGFPKLQLIYGDEYVYETLLALKFRISPDAFFQVNTLATEQLYKLVAEWSEATPKSTILDVCCGTGTIGLSMAKNVKQVIGVEMCEPAINDAKVNAQINGITNVNYICGKVEDVIHKVLKLVDESIPSPKVEDMSTTNDNATDSISNSQHTSQSSFISPTDYPLPTQLTNASTVSNDINPGNTAIDTPPECSTLSQASTVTLPANENEVASSNIGVNSGDINSLTASNVINNTKITQICESPQTEKHVITCNSATTEASKKDVIAIVDPPRAGVQKNVIKSLRACEDIHRLVYVSCSPSNAMENFVDLIRPCSSKLRGKAFTLEKAVAIDLFPQTKHAELLLLFTR